MSELVLHIGTKKTGTTFLQRFLSANKQRLVQEGWSYPGFLGNANHLAFALPFEHKVTTEQLARSIVDDASRAAFTDRLAQRLSKHLQPGQRWIMSSEYFSTRLQSPAEVEAAVEYLRQFFERITVVVFFRRQEFMFPSIYSQTVKDGASPSWTWDFCEKRLSGLDYSAMYSRWADAVGDQNIRALPYFETYKSDNDGFLAQFGDATGIDFTPDWVAPPESKVNRSLNAEAIAFMRIVNRYIPRLNPGNVSNYQQRQRAIKKVMELTPGPNFNPGPEFIDRLTEHYAASNAELLARLGEGEQWQRWINQTTHSSKPVVDVPDISASRVAELMVGLSEPAGPVAWGRVGARPYRFREHVGELLAKRGVRARWPDGKVTRKSPEGPDS